ncbi:hypothetical protein GCM10010123_43800 [Pilimelia anulata]|uniref:Clp R domain-containing protein n=1 Tax=Pilimelia anulata TaxID=53371 RepID=A0A8J3FGE4_9ACTN|nr:Clp protease N-terminal domain-containing protein [Pilimelia anulata]GGK09180.1 hypothetical protein GCM10010123_43800 [Pilimelia anulata]
MFERFTETAREVVVTATDRARAEHLSAAGTPSLWAALLVADGPAAALLRAAGADPAAAAAAARAALAAAGGRLSPAEEDALAGLGIDVAAVRASAEATFGPGALDEPAPAPRGWFRRGHLPLDPAARKALELSLREAIRLGHRAIGAEHLLLGVVHADPALAARVAPGVTLADLRERVRLAAAA